MARYVILHDRRLKGGIPARPGLVIINTDGDTSLIHAFRSIQRAAVHGRIDTLFIVCHGFAGQNKAMQMSMDAGGRGLQLGKEELRHNNVNMWRAIRGKVKHIVVMACAAADTQDGNQYTEADGRYLMGGLAINTDADVYAADKIQWYFTYRNLAHGKIDFRRWNGTIYHFFPGRGEFKINQYPDTNLAGVIGSISR